jgi:hypothetical protein
MATKTLPKRRGSAKSRPRRRFARPSFTTLDRLRIRNGGLLVTVELDQATEDFAHLIGKRIVIDGKIEICFSVERVPHEPPYKKGDRIGLLIRPGA